jgi:serine phosphatase RsbU (regulator of sigma subunit)
VIISTLACRLRVVTRCVPLDSGGDIHDVLVTPFGVRLLIGDVMGRGPSANETAQEVIAAWREMAAVEPSLPGVAVRLHTLISRSAHPERFVTALLANFAMSTEIVCCGHPPPLLLREGGASFIETFPAPPLGLLDLSDGWCSATTMPFTGGDALLLYTDGVTEARDADGSYFPLTEHAAAAMRESTDDGVLDHLLTSLRAHIGDEQADDILLLLAAR